jgi:hypothetical protein
MILKFLYRWLSIPSEKGWKPKRPASALFRYLCGALLLSVVITVAARIYTVQYQRKDADLTEQHLIRELSAKDGNQRWSALEQIRKRRAELIQSLLIIAKTKEVHYEFSDERAVAVRLLGEMRASEAVDTLINEITLKPPLVILFEDSPAEPYPCVKALIEIGDPAVRALLTRVKEKPSRDILILHVYIIYTVEGNWEAGALKIEKALKDSVSGRREYLQALMETYNQHRFVTE